MMEQEVRLLVVQGLYVVDEGAVVCLRIPEVTGFPPPSARDGFREGVVQLARACVGNVSDSPRPRVEEVAFDPRGEIRAHSTHDGARDVAEAQCAAVPCMHAAVSHARPVATGVLRRATIFPRPFHAAQSTRCRNRTQ